MIGQTIPHYRILEKSGEGGMGVVCRAEDTKLKCTVALKFLPSEFTRDAEAKGRSIYEAWPANSLETVNLCIEDQFNKLMERVKQRVEGV